MLELDISADEAIAIRQLSQSLCREYGSSDSEVLLHDLPSLTRELPQRVIDGVMGYMKLSTSDFALIRHHLVDDDSLGPTPNSWKTPASVSASLEHEMVTMLYGSILGSVFGWSTQQHGHLVNDLIPVESLADRQVGASSSVELAWHTEDAFHPGRADFICLFCLRNPTHAPTTVASLGDILKGGPPPTALFEACVHIAADDAQRAGANETDAKDWTGAALEAVPILTKTTSGLEMRIDPAYMSVCVEDGTVHDAVAQFCSAVNEHIREMVLLPGDLFILDNRHAVHGRRPFKPSYDGRDRWLKRVNVATQFETRADYCSDLGRRLLA